MTYDDLKNLELSLMMQLDDDRFRPRACELETRACLREVRELLAPHEDRQREERVTRSAMIAASRVANDIANFNSRSL